jgi:uncharacterized membrane protein HdeD (DUF308 family)
VGVHARQHGRRGTIEQERDMERDSMSEPRGEFLWPEERAGLIRETSRWWGFLALGAVAAVVGLILMFDLVAAATTLALLVALGLVVTGVGEIVSAGRYQTRLGVVAGGLLIIGGVLAAVWPDITLWVLAVLVGVDLVVSGLVRSIGAFHLRVEGWGWLLFGGVLSVIVGVVALAWPDATVLVLGLLLGLRMLLFGIAEVMFGLALHHVDQALRGGAGPAGPASDPV